MELKHAISCLELLAMEVNFKNVEAIDTVLEELRRLQERNIALKDKITRYEWSLYPDRMGK